MLPQRGTRLCLAGKARKCVHQRALFRDVLIKKFANATEGKEWKCKNREKQTKGECDHPPQCSEKGNHSNRGQVRCVYPLADQLWVLGTSRFWDPGAGRSPCALPV